MSDLGTYTFVPWLRQGVANKIVGGSPSSRARINVSVDIEGTTKDGGVITETVTRDIELYGPGDIVGIDSAVISRVEPEPWVTNFEPNYLPAIEFYDEDFPWRYTPAAPSGRRLQPWLALVVLEEGTEFSEAAAIGRRPLPFVEVTADFADVFPDAAESWAWAHVHFNGEFSEAIVDTDGARVSGAAANMIENDPDKANARILCPRKLKPKTGYHAFLIPAFESGRLAGLGLDPGPLFDEAANALTATSSSWVEYGVAANRPEGTHFPIYHRWYFRTAERGDFESLVRLLEPKRVDPRVGHRDIGVTDPAPNIAGIDKPELGGILRLGGALKAPLSPAEQTEHDVFDKWAIPYPQPFQERLATFLNLGSGYRSDGMSAQADPGLDPEVQADPDPLVTPPIYGRWHALTERLLIDKSGDPVPTRANWLHDVNLDPRWRTASGFGTTVIQENQEAYMAAAWDQVGDVLEANRRIRLAQMAAQSGKALHAKGPVAVQRSAEARVLMLAAPVSARIVSQGLTVRARMGQSPLGPALTSTAMRRALRPGGRSARKLGLTEPAASAELVERVNVREITPAPPPPTPEKLLTPEVLGDAVDRSAPPGSPLDMIGRWLDRNRTLALVLAFILTLLLLVILGPLGLVLAAAGIVGAYAIWRRERGAGSIGAVADTFSSEGQTPDAIDALAPSATFELDETSLGASPPPVAPADTSAGEADNAVARRFKAGLADQYRLVSAHGKLGALPETVSLELPRIAGEIVRGIDPAVTVPRWTLSGISIPARILAERPEQFVEAMVYPEFDQPMYEPLVRAGTELFVPNLHLVPPDSVTLLETNQEFIEAYMVGLNHEFARELLWREYPSDQRGSYFRQFWDVRKKLAAAEDPEAAREQLKDIKPIHRWPRGGDLGDNDNREAGAEAEQELVLVIRGELLKKYPNTIVSAQRAAWQTTDGEIDKTMERTFDAGAEPIEPLYEARVAPDLYFFGFDLTAAEALGDDSVDDKPGWFFRIEEVPGDARFGFDVARDASDPVLVWNDLAWADVVPSLVDGTTIKVSEIPHRQLTTEPSGTAIDRLPQWEFDKHVAWDADGSAAELAYIALQTPVIMAVHASELLPREVGSD